MKATPPALPAPSSTPARDRSAALRTIVGLGTALTVSCVSGGPSDADLERERRAQRIFEDLMTRGQPIESGLDTFDDAEVESFDRAVRSLQNEGAGDEVADAEGDGPDGDTAQAEPEPYVEPPINPYLEFGPNIIWYPLRDGHTERLILRPFTLPKGSGQKIFDLLKLYGDFPLHAAVTDGALEENTPPQPQDAVLLDLRPAFSVEAYANPRQEGLRSPEGVALSDVLFVTATAENLREVEHFINIFSADVRQIEVEAKIVEVTTREALDLGVRPIDANTPTFEFPNQDGFLRAAGYSFGNSVEVTEALFEVGAVFDGVTFNAILEAVETFEDVSIISRPKVAVREGGRADIVNITRIPFYNVTGISAAGIPTTSLQFQDVGVQLFVIPRIVGRDTVVLNVDIEASQATGTAVSFTVGESVISVPQVSQRTARTIVRLEPGQAVILGGLVSERTVERESKVPILGDIPLLGMFFKSTLKSREKSNVLFFIRPRILEGADLNIPFDTDE